MTEKKADKEVLYICEHHLDKKEHWTPLIYNRELDKSICPKCNARYNMFTGLQVLWTKELEEKAIHYATIMSNGGNVVKEKFLESEPHPTPLETAPEKPEPKKNFEQQLHDWIIDWKNHNPTDDHSNHSRASKVLFDLYSDKAQRGWSDFQIKQYFNIPNLI
jgi:hypothetical protein